MSSPDPVALGRFRDIFCPRIDDHAYWTGWSWVRARAPLTIDVLAAGLAGRPSISSYMTDADGRSQVFAHDLDIDHDGIETARQIALWMASVGVDALLEPSRNDRAHLWVLLDATIPASFGRRFLSQAEGRAGIDPDDRRIERFPKSDSAPDQGEVGSCLRLPMMPNPKNGVRYPLLDPWTMQPLGTTLAEVVAAVQVAPAQRVIELAGPEPEPAEVFERFTPMHISEFNEQYSVSAVLEELWGVSNAEPGRSVRCPAHDDVHPSLSVFADDRRVLCYAPECILNNGGRGRDAYDLFQISPMLAAQP